QTATDIQNWIYLACILSVAGAALINVGNTPATAWCKVIGYILCGLAIAAASYALYLAIADLGIKYGQGWLATIYGIGAAIAGVAAIAAITGNAAKAVLTNTLWVAGAAAVISLVGGMLGSDLF
ncbi:MAG: hypothetical protein COT18_10940, partial [Elusimicrobia bacterium CG08_land_8_20_14_0_20_59_10]